MAFPWITPLVSHRLVLTLSFPLETDVNNSPASTGTWGKVHLPALLLSSSVGPDSSLETHVTDHCAAPGTQAASPGPAPSRHPLVATCPLAGSQETSHTFLPGEDVAQLTLSLKWLHFFSLNLSHPNSQLAGALNDGNLCSGESVSS